MIIFWPSKKAIVNALAEALSQFYETKLVVKEAPESIVTLQNDLKTLVRHGSRIEKIMVELSAYTHRSIHDLLNVATIMLALVNEADMPDDKKKELVIQLQGILKTKP